MSERKITSKRNTKTENNIFFKKTLIQSAVSVVILVIMILSIRLGGKNSYFNTQVRKYLNESTDIKTTTRNVYTKAREVINDEIIPVFNNISINND